MLRQFRDRRVALVDFAAEVGVDVDMTTILPEGCQLLIGFNQKALEHERSLQPRPIQTGHIHAKLQIPYIQSFFHTAPFKNSQPTIYVMQKMHRNQRVSSKTSSDIILLKNQIVI
ncbi:MAG: hypothetical protein AMJ68_03415, partial [Acidithiobacillales bacterium SG8_45]